MGLDVLQELPDRLKRHVVEFQACLPMQVMLHEIRRALGKTDGLMCLDVGLENGMMAYQLRRMGGKWHSAVAGEAIAEDLRGFVQTNVDVISGRALPFKKKIFDVVVVANFLEKVEADDIFIEECHRILQPAGRLIVNVKHAKKWTLARPLQKMMGLTPVRCGRVREGYTESELFAILKHGFDVHHMRSYSRILVEMVDTVVQAMLLRCACSADSSAGVNRVLRVAGPLYRIAYQFDMLLFLGKGFDLIASGKRRAWRPRNAPVLVDGRSISEAVLSKASN